MPEHRYIAPEKRRKLSSVSLLREFISELWEFPPFAAISQYLLCQCPSFSRKQPSFFVLKCLLNNKCLRARLPGSNCDWGPMRGLKNTIWSALTLRKWRGSCFSVLLHNDESYYWALLEPGRLHLPTSLSLRPWGWWQRPAGKFSWLTNFIFTWYLLSTRFSRSGWTLCFWAQLTHLYLELQAALQRNTVEIIPSPHRNTSKLLGETSCNSWLIVIL